MGYAIKIGGIGSLSENDRNKIITIYNRVVPNGTLLGYIRDDWLTSSEFNNLLYNKWFYKCFIGQRVSISNSASETATSMRWLIIDRDHERSGNSYDLMASMPVRSTKLNTVIYNTGTNDRVWLNGTFYDGFEWNIKTWMVPMCIQMYYDNTRRYVMYDKVKLPSATELDATWLVKKFGYADGEEYRLVPNGCGAVTAGANFWTRSWSTTANRWMIEYARGRAVEKKASSNSYGLVPIIRVANNYSNP